MKHSTLAGRDVSVGALVMVSMFALGCARHGHSKTARDATDEPERTSTADVADRPEAARGAGQEYRAEQQAPLQRAGEGQQAPGAAADGYANGSESGQTPLDQSEKESDIRLVQDIRKNLTANDELSFSAKNVKVIVRSGEVTLRGAVASERERTIVEDAARREPGVTVVRSSLEIDSQ